MNPMLWQDNLSLPFKSTGKILQREHSNETFLEELQHMKLFCLRILQNELGNFCEVLALTVIRRTSQRVKYKHSNKREEVIDIATLHPAITSSCAYQIFRTEQSDQENTSHN